MATNLTYKDAGVDIDAGEELVERIKGPVKRTTRPEVIGGLGGFGALTRIPKGYTEPVLVSGTDGVGTKLRLAIDLERHNTVGQDLVAMCVNDLIVQGAEPLLFLDYYATGKLNVDVAASVVTGIANGCEMAGCALVGGETAEMPGMYDVNHYDLAGFCVGAVDKKNLKDSRDLQVGDVLIGLPSSGVHSNGFSLVRKVLLEDNHLDVHDTFEELGGQRLGDVLLTPTVIYVKPVKALLKKKNIHAMAHITGGGFYENVPRMLKDGMGVEIDTNTFPRPAIFDFIQKRSDITDHEMYNVFNMGIGFVMAVDPADVDDVRAILSDNGQESYVIGHVTDTGEVKVL